MTIIRWHKRPVRSNIFDDMFEKGFQTGFERNYGGIPTTNILEDENSFEIQLAVPGLNKEDFRMEMEENVLSVFYEKKEEDKEKPDVEYLRREFEMEAFTRSFSIPKTVDAENIKAKYDNGILYISIPKMDKARLSKQIKVS